MANTTTILNRIDPTEGLTEYVQAIKPYHSKILDVLVEYVYSDTISVSIIDRQSSLIGLAGANVDVMFHDRFATPPYSLLTNNAQSGAVYACGYGYKWSEYGITAPDVSVSVDIISANADGCPDDAVSQDPSVIIYGTACHSNSLLVKGVISASYNVIVSSIKADEFVFTNPHGIIGVDRSAQAFNIAENLVTGGNTLAVGTRMYIPNNGTNQNYIFQVKSTIINSAGGTTIFVRQSIPSNVSVGGIINISSSFDSIPYWESGIKISIDSVGGVIPTGINTTVPLYFIPSSIPGTFKISQYRYPREVTDYTNLTSIGSGVLTITRDEPFVPGQTIDVRNTYKQHNDGQYIIGRVVPEGINFRIYTLQPLMLTTPTGLTIDGTATVAISGYDLPPYCGLAAASPLHADTFIHERLEITFSGGSDLPDLGYGEMEFGSDDTYGIVSTAPISITAGVQPSYTVILSTGFDTGLFDATGIGQ